MNTRLLLIEVGVVLAIALLPEAAFGGGAYGYGPGPGLAPPWAAPGAPEPTLRLERSADSANYYLTVRLAGIQPKAVTVTPFGGRWLAIGTQDDRQSSNESLAEDGRSWSRSFSYSSGGQVRRLTLPPDADLAALHREDGTDQVKITIPRRH
jgi:hypothetical protein